METIIKLKNITFGYQDNIILNNINLEIKKGDYVGIIGSNGVGKSTLLKLMLNEMKPLDGSVDIFGVKISEFKDWKKVGYVNQKANSFVSSFPATVQEVVAMNLSSKIGLFRSINKSHLKEVDRVLDLVGMEECKHKLIGELSGGQQQKVFIARSLVNSPEILFLDEPTVGIDLSAQSEFYSLLSQLNKRLNLTIVMVSHDISIIKHEVKKLVCLKDKKVDIYDNCEKTVSREIILDCFY
jgi:zinc transport system ATP-binding protein